MTILVVVDHGFDTSWQGIAIDILSKVLGKNNAFNELIFLGLMNYSGLISAYLKFLGLSCAARYVPHIFGIYL